MLYDINGNTLEQVYVSNGSLSTDGGFAMQPQESDTGLYFDHGKLHKDGLFLYDEHNKKMEIRGIGTHAIMQYTNLHTLEAFSSLYDFGINCIRISLYLENYNFLKSDGLAHKGYIGNEAVQDEEIQRIVNLCEQLGLYVILDWHVYSWGAGSGTGIFHQSEAEAFFNKYCNMYKDKPFVMYEIANEPHHQTISEYVPFIKAIRTIIKSYIADPVMITGVCKESTTDLWAALINEGIDDIFISSHAYGHDIDPQKYQTLLDAGIPMFNTEWGNAQATGDGEREDARATVLMKYYHKEKIPHCVWKLTDQDMTCAVLKNTGTINSEKYASGFSESDLSAEGKLYFTWFKYFATK